jgi:hypothetical protein
LREQAIEEGAEPALFGGGEAGLGSRKAVLAQHRPFAPDHLQPGILGQQPIDIGVAAPAVAAGIVEEFDQHDVPVLGTCPGAAERRFEQGAVRLDQLGNLAVLQFDLSVAQQLRILHEVIADHAFDLGAAATAGAARCERDGRGADQRTQPADQSHSSKPVHARLHRRLSFLSTAARETSAISWARIQSGLPIGIAAMACSALASARRGWFSRL